MDWKQWATKVGIRTIRTFLQSFLGVLVASGSNLIEISVIENAMIAGLVSAVTALQNGLEEWSPSNKG
jgi:hypothetical protein|tara:strand:- start:471 stop:674 length:204 start_codon:yes stop_codon:yes gene_type:complete